MASATYRSNITDRNPIAVTAKWDFRLFRVVSINTSGHKYGLAYPGVGWGLGCRSDVARD